MRISLKLSQQGLILVGVPVALMLFVLLSLLLLLLRVEKEAQDADRSKTVITRANSLVKEYYDAASQLLMYKYAKTEKFRQRFENQLAGTESSFMELHDLLKDDPAQLVLLAELQRTARRGMALLRQFEKRLQQNENIPTLEATVIYKEFDAAGADFTSKLHDLIAHETLRHRINSEEEQKGRLLVKVFISAGVVAAIGLGIALAVFFTRNTTSRLAMLMDNTQRLGKGQSLLPVLEGDDEIARLDLFFHKMAEDLSEATRKERAILDNAVDVICSINADGHFSAINPASYKSWGYPPAELVGLPYLKVIAQEDLEKFRCALDRIKQDRKLVTLESRVITQNKEILHVLWSLAWSDSEQSLFCVAHDVTDLKRVEQLKQDFLAVISHELRTPLTSLQATLTLLGSGVYGELSSNGAKRVKSAESGIARLIMLINDLLDIEKMESGKLSMSYQDIDISAVIEGSLEAVQGYAEEQGVCLTAHKRALTVLADSDRLVQVMVNLLSNAIKFSEEGGEVNITIEVQGSYCEVSVIDHGAGIPYGYEEKIFTKYEQAPNDGRRRHQGTGLGLPICKAIVEQHGGTIGVKNTEGGGSTFWFRVPCSEAAAAPVN